jgi:hypothetical protein
MAPIEPDGPPTPRWVKVFTVIAVIVGLAFLILHLAGGGPARHTVP